MALEVLEDAMGGEIFRAGKRDDGAPPRGPEVRDLFQFKGAAPGFQSQTADFDGTKGEEDAEAKRIAMQRGARRQTSFPANPLGRVLTMRELDHLSTVREKYLRKAKKFMKKRDDESDDDEDDDDDDDDDEDDNENKGKENEPEKEVAAKGSTFIRISDEGNCEVVPGDHVGLVPIAQTTYVVNGNVEGYAPLDQDRFPRIAKEFPQSKWTVLRNYDGHYKICHESAPTHIYGSLGLAREFMATLPEEEIGKFGDPPFIPKMPKEGEDPGPKTFATPNPALTSKPFAQQRLFAKSQFDEFCGDVPSAPEIIRRCLAIVRSICNLGQISDKFVYPTNTKDVPTFYEKVLRPTCLIDIGRKLLAAAEDSDCLDEAKLVNEFVDDMHLLYNNAYCYNVVGSVAINNVEKVATVFERLLYDWLLQPELPPLEELDDDKCYAGGRHPSDDEFPMLICDKCEVKYNMNRLQPPLERIPKNDWFCPRCVGGECWFKRDQRIGKIVSQMLGDGTFTDAKIVSCGVMDAKLAYTVSYENEKGTRIVDQWSLEDVDAQLGDKVPKIRFVEAVCKSLGYNNAGRDHGVTVQLLPPNVDPRFSVKAAELAATSSTFLEAINGVITMNTKAEDRNSKGWVEVFKLLAAQCANASDVSAEIEEYEKYSKNIYQKKAYDLGAKMAKPVLDLLKEEHLDEFVVVDDNEADVEEVNSARADGGDAMEVEVIDEPVTVELIAENDDGAEHMKNATAIVAGGGDNDVEMADADVVVAMVEGADDETPSHTPSPVPPSASVSPTPPGGLVQPTITSTFLTPEAIAAAEKKREREEELLKRNKRSRLREDAFTSHLAIAQLKRALGEEEAAKVSPVVITMTTEPGIAKFECAGVVCRFCGQTDKQLGQPLLRFPAEDEWRESIKHAACDRVWNTVAEDKEGKLSLVKIRVGGELVSVRASRTQRETLELVPDKGTRDCLPWNPVAFQEELERRVEEGAPVTSGSLAVHENCAIAMHLVRQERVKAEKKTKILKQYEEDEMRGCGRSIPLGEDSVGRLYWCLASDFNALVVFDRPVNKYVRYTTPASIASVIVALGDDEPAPELARLYPAAEAMVRDRSWVTVLQADDGDQSEDEYDFSSEKRTLDDMDLTEQGPGVPSSPSNPRNHAVRAGKSVLVVSPACSQYWDAKVLDVATDDSGAIVGYRVHYKKWSTRFDEWVHPDRVLPRDKANLEAQAELSEGDSATVGADALLPTLKSLEKDIRAFKHLYSQDRARGDVPPHPFDVALRVQDPNSSEEKVRSIASMFLTRHEHLLT